MLLCIKTLTTRGGAVAARWAHNPKVAGSNPAPATKNYLFSIANFNASISFVKFSINFVLGSSAADTKDAILAKKYFGKSKLYGTILET